MEIWDVYDADRIKTGETTIRGKSIREGGHHLVVHACIFNSAGEMLIQQRQPFKVGWPNRWDITVGGSAIVGDSSCMAIERELFEELGLKMDLKNRRPHLTVNFPSGFDDIYLINEDVDLNTLNLQYEEVQAVQWASKDEIFRMIDSGEFIPFYKGLISYFFEARQGFGCQSTDE